MAKPLIIVVKFAFWWRFYVFGLVLFSALTGANPDPDKLAYWMRKAVRYTTPSGKKIKGLN